MINHRLSVCSLLQRADSAERGYIIAPRNSGFIWIRCLSQVISSSFPYTFAFRSSNFKHGWSCVSTSLIICAGRLGLTESNLVLILVSLVWLSWYANGKRRTLSGTWPANVLFAGRAKTWSLTWTITVSLCAPTTALLPRWTTFWRTRPRVGYRDAYAGIFGEKKGWRSPLFWVPV